MELHNVPTDAGYPEHWQDYQHEMMEEDQLVGREQFFPSAQEGTSCAYDDVTGAALSAQQTVEGPSQILDSGV